MTRRRRPNQWMVAGMLAVAAAAAGPPCEALRTPALRTSRAGPAGPERSRHWHAEGPAIGAGGDRAEQVLAAARLAIGGHAVAHLSGLSLAGRVRRAIGAVDQGVQVEGHLRINLHPPGQYLRHDTFTLAGTGVSRMEGFDGEVWIVQAPGSRRQARAGGVDAGRAPDAPATAAVRRLRADATRLALGLLASSPFIEAGYEYAGVAESPDGRAEVVVVRAGSGPAARLFLDVVSHRPVMVSFEAVPMPDDVMGLPWSGSGLAPSRQAIAALARDVEARMRAAREASARPVEARLCFDEFRAASGLVLPHRITHVIGDRVVEQWDIEVYQVNPPVPARETGR